MAAENVRIPLAALFHDRAKARQAIDELEVKGVPESDVTVLSRNTMRADSFDRIHVQPGQQAVLLQAIQADAVLIAVAALPAQENLIRGILQLPASLQLPAMNDAPKMAAAQSRTLRIPRDATRTSSSQADVVGGANAGDALFVPRTWMLSEVAEHAVVSTRPRVVEEVVVSRTPTSRVERIHETLRHTEVEIGTLNPTEPAT